MVYDDPIVDPYYVNIENSSFTIYFIDDHRFVTKEVRKIIVDTELGSSVKRYNLGGTYTVSGNKLTITYADNLFGGTRTYTYRNGQFEDYYTLSKEGTMSSSDLSWAEDTYLQFLPDKERLDVVFIRSAHKNELPTYYAAEHCYYIISAFIFKIEAKYKPRERLIGNIQMNVQIDNGYFSKKGTVLTRTMKLVGGPDDSGEMKISEPHPVYLQRDATMTIEYSFYDGKHKKMVSVFRDTFRVSTTAGTSLIKSEDFFGGEAKL